MARDSTASTARGARASSRIRHRRNRVREIAGDDERVALARAAAEVRGGYGNRVEAEGLIDGDNLHVVQAIGLARVERVVAEERRAEGAGDAEVEIVHQLRRRIGNAARDAGGI